MSSPGPTPACDVPAAEPGSVAVSAFQARVGESVLSPPRGRWYLTSIKTFAFNGHAALAGGSLGNSTVQALAVISL